MLCDAICDYDVQWLQCIEEKPCETCLRAEASKLPGGGELPRSEGLLYVDISHVNVQEFRTGFKIIVGVVHAATNFRKSMRVARKSDAPLATPLTWWT